jgi:hypothetical protein
MSKGRSFELKKKVKAYSPIKQGDLYGLKIALNSFNTKTQNI